MKALLLVNPVSGKGAALRNLEPVRNKLTELSIHPETIFSASPGYFCQSFPLEKLSDISLLVVLGGDGFLNEVVNGLPESFNIPILFLPSGSGNDIGRALDISLKKFYLIPQLKPFYRKFDLGFLKLTESDSSIINRKFLSSCGLGFDALVSRISTETKWIKGLPLYLLSTLRALKQLKPFEASIKTTEAEWSGVYSLLTTGNTATMGGGFKLTPYSVIDDGLLDFMAAEGVSKNKLLSILPKAIQGSHIHLPEVSYVKSDRIEISLAAENNLHLDGEFISSKVTRAEITVIPAALQFHIY